MWFYTIGVSAGTDDVGEWILTNPRASHARTAPLHRVGCRLLCVECYVYVCLAHSKRVKGGNRFIHDEEKEMNVIVGAVGVSCVLLCVVHFWFIFYGQ